MHRKRTYGEPWSFLARSWFAQMYVEKLSKWRCLSLMGRSCRTRSHLSNVRTRRIFSSQTKLVDLCQKSPGNTGGPLRKRSDFNQALCTLKLCTPRIWKTTTQAHALIGSTRNGTHHRVLFPVGGNGVDLGGLKKNSRESIKEDACKDFWLNEETRWVRFLDKNLDERLSRICFLFSILLRLDRLQLTAFYCNRRGV